MYFYRIRRGIYLLLIGGCLAACHNVKENKQLPANKEQQEPALPAMKISKENWGGNITLHIHTKEQLSSQVMKYRLLSTYQSKVVGFDLLMKKPEKNSPFVSDGASFQAIGDTSNNFLKSLAAVYNLPPANLVFVDSIKATYVNLLDMLKEDKEGKEGKVAAQYKLFFATDEEGSELLMNIDEAGRTISFPEKAIEYRQGIIQALSKR